MALPLQKTGKLGDFLHFLQGRGKHKYSRYKGLPLRYAGGKSLAVGYILENLPAKVNYLVSPFIGGASFEIACAKELNIEVKAYDIFDILVNYWQVQLEDKDSLVRKLSEWQPTQQAYDRVKQRLKSHWMGEEIIDDRVELAAHYWFNHNLSYGPGFLGWMSKIYQCPNRYARLLDKMRVFDCPSLSVATASFEQTISDNQDVFLYCDPPYFLNGDSKMFRGIYPQRNFPVHHKNFKHDVLRDLLHQHHGGFILSYNDCDVIRDWYKDYDIKEVKWQYTLGQGETRIGKNRINNATGYIKQSHELLIIG